MIAETIVQCPQCFRYVCGGAVVALSFGESAAAIREDRLKSEPCNLSDCGEVVSYNAQRDQARRERRLENRRERHEAKQVCRSQESEARRQNPATEPRVARMPYRDAEAEEAASSEQRAGSKPAPLGTDVGEVIETVRTFGQRDFEASGAADSQNAKRAEFFNPLTHPHNFRKWFKASFLEEMSGSRRMNNRAVDLRKSKAEGGPGFIEAGLYLGNYMMRDENTDKVASSYGLFPIEECKSLTPEQKLKLIATD